LVGSEKGKTRASGLDGLKLAEANDDAERREEAPRRDISCGSARVALRLLAGEVGSAG
jgi:hypothetical protein